jgi:hypothetical protein
MNPVIRSVLAVIAGMLVAFVLIFVVQGIGIRVYPPPPGMSPVDPESFKAMRMQVPVRSLLFVLLSYTVGSLAGGWVAARFAPSGKMTHAMILAALLFGAGLMNLMTIPHPAWFWVASSAIYWLAAWSGARAAGASGPAAPARA